jgi:hypothetical protein
MRRRREADLVTDIEDGLGVLNGGEIHYNATTEQVICSYPKSG